MFKYNETDWQDEEGPQTHTYQVTLGAKMSEHIWRAKRTRLTNVPR